MEYALFADPNARRVCRALAARRAAGGVGAEAVRAGGQGGDLEVGTGHRLAVRHYFNLEDDLMQEIIDGWAVPDVEVFAADLEPVCADPAADDGDAPPVVVQSPPRPADE